MPHQVHDVDFIRWILGAGTPLEVLGTGSSSTAELEACGVLDNATMYLKFQGGVICNIMMSRGSTYGYDQRCEVYGDQGIASIHSTNETSLSMGDKTGVHQAPLQYSFPQCFREAFELEIETFVDTLLTQTPWPISEEDCVLAQLIAMTAKESCRVGRMLPFHAVYTPSPITLRPIGNGNFAKHMLGVLAGCDEKHHMFNVLTPYSPSSTLGYERDVLGDPAVQAVYVCSPDKHHHTHATECLLANKHVLVEKPVYHFNDLMSTYETMLTSLKLKHSVPPVLMVGFHRRFDPEFLRAKQVCASTPPSSILIESRDPVSADSDLAFVLRNSMCHDVDLIHWLFSGDHDTNGVTATIPSEVSIQFIACVTDVRTSHIELTGQVTVNRPAPQRPLSIYLKIVYCKEHTSYVQKCVLDGVIFGYDFVPEVGALNPYHIYQSAYTAQWECFARLIREAEETQSPGNSQQDRDRARWEGYQNTFGSLAQAEELLLQSLPQA